MPETNAGTHLSMLSNLSSAFSHLSFNLSRSITRATERTIYRTIAGGAFTRKIELKVWRSIKQSDIVTRLHLSLYTPFRPEFCILGGTVEYCWLGWTIDLNTDSTKQIFRGQKEKSWNGKQRGFNKSRKPVYFRERWIIPQRCTLTRVTRFSWKILGFFLWPNASERCGVARSIQRGASISRSCEAEWNFPGRSAVVASGQFLNCLSFETELRSSGRWRTLKR